jgi:predicted nucleic acid-binding protein
MRCSTRSLCLVPDPRRPVGLLDTSVVIDLERIAEAGLPEEVAISSLTMAELAAGPHATSDLDERARRQERLQRAETMFDPLPFDAEAARAYGVLYAAVASLGRKARGRRAIDLLIAAVARANHLPLFTRNPDDFSGLEAFVDIVAVDL